MSQLEEDLVKALEDTSKKLNKNLENLANQTARKKVQANIEDDADKINTNY